MEDTTTILCFSPSASLLGSLKNFIVAGLEGLGGSQVQGKVDSPELAFGAP